MGGVKSGLHPSNFSFLTPLGTSWLLLTAVPPNRAGARGWWETLSVNPAPQVPMAEPPRGLKGLWPRGAWREWPTSHYLCQSPSPTRALFRVPFLAWATSPWSVRSFRDW